RADPDPDASMGLQKLPRQDCHRGAAQHDPLSLDSDADNAAARRRLKTGQLALAEPGAPKRAEAAMGRAADGVFVDADGGSKKTRDEIEPRIVGTGRHDHAPRRNRLKSREVGSQRAERL